MTRNKSITIALLITAILIIATVLIINYTQKTADNLMQGTNNIETTAVSGGTSE